MRTRQIKFDDDKIPAWTYDGSDPGIHTFTAATALSSLEDTMIRLSSSRFLELPRPARGPLGSGPKCSFRKTKFDLFALDE